MRPVDYRTGHLLLLLLLIVHSDLAIPSMGKSSMEGLSCARGYYGERCRHHCHCRASMECDVMRGCVGECAEGWSGPACQSQNIAFNMPTKIRAHDPDLNSRSAVDGNSSSCVTSDPDQRRGWLQVDLKASNEVYYVTLITNASSARGWQLYVTDFGEYGDIYWASPCTTVRSDSAFVRTSCDSPTRGRYLTLLNPQGPVAVCEIQAHVCADYTFGSDCGLMCQCADASEVCHPLTGRCRTGCQPGFTGRNCQLACQRSYGSHCVHQCGRCSRGEACDPVNGHCPGECQPGWTGSHCNTSCPPGFYGDRCSERCGACQDGATCDAHSGFCPGQCEAGYHGPHCHQACKPGHHGPSCLLKCGQCVHNKTCHPVTGVCRAGCNAGWEGVFCTQECAPRNYGVNCGRECSRCLTSCDSVSGVCDPFGCVAGKRGKRCNQDCHPGLYGLNCSHTCGFCEGSASCDIVSGICLSTLCMPGWIGSACHTACADRLYGQNCTEECGSCKGGAICDHVTGDCPVPGDCEDGFHGDKCQTMSIFLDTTSQTSIALIASILAVVLFVLLLLFICLCLKWTREEQTVPFTCV